MNWLVREARRKKKYSPEAQEAIGEKMHKMEHEKGPHRPKEQEVAIAISEAREKGLKVPEPKK